MGSRLLGPAESTQSLFWPSHPIISPTPPPRVCSLSCILHRASGLERVSNVASPRPSDCPEADFEKSPCRSCSRFIHLPRHPRLPSFTSSSFTLSGRPRSFPRFRSIATETHLPPLLFSCLESTPCRLFDIAQSLAFFFFLFRSRSLVQPDHGFQLPHIRGPEPAPGCRDRQPSWPEAQLQR